MHEALTACFGGKLTLAPLESNPPKTILEMGYVFLYHAVCSHSELYHSAGSGAWSFYISLQVSNESDCCLVH